MIEATVHIVWDEEGNVAAHVEADEAAELLENASHGRFRRVLALRVSLPSAGPIEMDLDVTDTAGTPTLKGAKLR